MGSALPWALPGNCIFSATNVIFKLARKVPDPSVLPWLDSLLTEDFHGRVLPFDERVSVRYADVVADRERIGRTIGVADAQIAAICRDSGALLAMHNAPTSRKRESSSSIPGSWADLGRDRPDGASAWAERPGVSNRPVDPFGELLVGFQVLSADPQPSLHRAAAHYRQGDIRRSQQDAGVGGSTRTRAPPQPLALIAILR
jgi:hypothetical protein